MVEEVREPAVISFPDSALREGKMSGVATFLHNYLQERGGEREGERIIKFSRRILRAYYMTDKPIALPLAAHARMRGS